MRTVIVLRQCCVCGAVRVGTGWRWTARCRVVTPRIRRAGVQYVASHGYCPACEAMAMEEAVAMSGVNTR